MTIPSIRNQTRSDQSPIRCFHNKAFRRASLAEKRPSSCLGAVPTRSLSVRDGIAEAGGEGRGFATIAAAATNDYADLAQRALTKKSGSGRSHVQVQLHRSRAVAASHHQG